MPQLQDFMQNYPNRRNPSNVTIQTLTQRAWNGTLIHQRRHYQYDENDPRVITILAMIHLDPHIGSRQIERETDIPQSTVIWILNARRYHVYHITLMQPQMTWYCMYVFIDRLCEWFDKIITSSGMFFFSDESTFKNTGELNKHNYHYWSNVNPHWFRSVDNQNRWSLMVWCGIVNGYLIGSYLFEENMNRINFLELLRDILPELLENVDLATRRRMWIQLDGAPPHYAHIVRNYLNNHYNGMWISPVAWPSSSPDLTFPDFYLWEYLKNVVYIQRFTYNNEKEYNGIRTAYAVIPRRVLLKTVS